MAGEFVAFTDFGPEGGMDTSHEQDGADESFDASTFDVDLSDLLADSGHNDTELTGEFVAF